MTQQQETRFRCDRCGTDISVPLNEQPALQRGQPPADWLALHYISGPTGPATHLCPSCKPMFFDFMGERNV